MKNKINYINLQKCYNFPAHHIFYDINQLPIKEYKRKWYFLIDNKLYWTNQHGFENRIKGGFNKKANKPYRLRQMLKTTKGELVN